MSCACRIVLRLANKISTAREVLEIIEKCDWVVQDPYTFLDVDGDGFNWVTGVHSSKESVISIQQERLDLDKRVGYKAEDVARKASIWIMYDPCESLLTLELGADYARDPMISRAVSLDIIRDITHKVFKQMRHLPHSIVIELDSVT